MSKLESYGLKSFYKGTFLKYVDENYIDTGNLKAYIAVPDIILTNPDTTIMSETVTSNNILNASSLNYNLSIDSVHSIICKPIYLNNVTPILEEGDEVFVFIMDEDPKKIFYASFATAVKEDRQCKFILRIGHSLLYIDRDEIRLVHELDNPRSDNSVTVSEFGIEFVGENIIFNGTNLGDLIKDVTTLKKNLQDKPIVIGDNENGKLSD